MKTIHTVRTISIICLAACCIAVGCTQNSGESRSPATASAAPSPLQASAIVLGPGAQGDTGMNAPPPQPQDLTKPIPVRIDLTGTRKAGARLHAKLIRLDDSRVVAEQTVALASDSAAPIRFEFSTQGPWQPGRYLFELTHEGKLLGQRDMDLAAMPQSAPAPSK